MKVRVKDSVVDAVANQAGNLVAERYGPEAGFAFETFVSAKLSKNVSQQNKTQLGFAADGGAKKNAFGTNWRSSKDFGHTFTRHGEGAKNTVNLRGRAAGTGQSQGQWLNNEAAAKFLSDLPRNVPVVTVRIPAGLGHLIKPDGTIAVASWARVITSVSGIRTAYPVIL
jgi:hypothetical protein